MAKKLLIKFPEKCVGCDLCVLEAQRQLNKVGLEGSPIRIFNSKKSNSLLEDVTYEIDLSNEVQQLDVEKIAKICPTAVFELQDVKSSELKEEELI